MTIVSLDPDQFAAFIWLGCFCLTFLVALLISQIGRR